MAEIIKTSIPFAGISGEIAFTQATGNDYLVLDNADVRTALLIRNANTQNASVTIKAGDGSLSSLGDITVTAGGSKSVAVPFSRAESARVKVTEGTDRGKVFLSASVDTGGSLSNLLFAVLSVE